MVSSDRNEKRRRQRDTCDRFAQLVSVDARGYLTMVENMEVIALADLEMECRSGRVSVGTW